MKIFSGIKFHTRIIISFVISFVLFVIVYGISFLSVKGGMDASASGKVLAVGIVGGLITFAIMFIFALDIAKSSRVSLESLVEAVDALEKGDSTVRAKKHTTDEFGHLIDGINNLAETTDKFAGIAEAVAEGNLTVTVTPRSDGDKLGHSLQRLVEDNLHALSNINDGAYQVMTSSAQVASASESLAQGSAEQASAIEEVTASIAEVADKTKQNAEEANRAAELVGKVIADVQDGNKEMSQMLDAMNDINQSSESISKIIKVIDDIAFQTNILALNAAVEAARAGDAGKGFAVVAEEVRNLAAKSAQAASETADLIEDSIAKVGVGSDIANETYKSLELITEAIRESESLINGIADSSNYQATAVAQINQAVNQISQVVQTNSATSEQCAAAADELSGQASKMRELLSVYDLGLGTSTKSKPKRRVSDGDNPNEKIISLGDDFGKY